MGRGRTKAAFCSGHVPLLDIKHDQRFPVYAKARTLGTAALPAPLTWADPQWVGTGRGAFPPFKMEKRESQSSYRLLLKLDFIPLLACV